MESAGSVERLNSLYLSRNASSCSAPDYPNNMGKTPSMIVNMDKLCIYYSDDDSIYGSFKKRPKYAYQAVFEESEVIMRLKVQESEHMCSSRYESIFTVPLCQQLTISKYQNESFGEFTNNVGTMVNQLNQLCLSDKEKEAVIDIALLESIRKTKIVATSPSKIMEVLQQLQKKKALRWMDMDMVRSRDLMDKLSREEIVFQESQFELITSEASYYQSLNVLIDKFYHSPLLSLDSKSTKSALEFYIKPHQKEHLFSNILRIHSISGRFLADLERRFSESVLMKNVCDIVTTYAKSQFSVYIPYIQNQKFQAKAYIELKGNEKAAKVIAELERQPACCSLSLDSFLLLPMQRLLRIMLLLKTIKKNLPRNYTLSEDSVAIAIHAMDTIIEQCSVKKGHMDERQRMLEISRSLSFKSNRTVLPISSGTLLHEGEVKCHRKNLGSRNYLSGIRRLVYDAWLILTDEYLMITKVVRDKRKTYLVEDWSPLAAVFVMKTSREGKSEDSTSVEFCVTFRNSNTYIVQTKTREIYVKWMSELSKCPQIDLSSGPS